MINKRELTRMKRHRRIRLKVHGCNNRPRLTLRRSLKNLHACILDDSANKILFSLSTLDKEIKSKIPNAGNIKAAQYFGEVVALKAKEKGIVRIVFDRAGYLYHGRVRAFADALRKGGLEF